ncbi:protein of unknown function [Methylorubrum extorquens]|uniref:Uncharacterized protein n=1 Tax=Methylorubrum extorquens TaxID=408 RepID=A0A2N9AJS3_METEX|nr:protein of unknown function [Methylorubrum extorquens]
MRCRGLSLVLRLPHLRTRARAVSAVNQRQPATASAKPIANGRGKIDHLAQQIGVGVLFHQPALGQLTLLDDRED